ncbi:MAG: hypothetical protein WCD70_03235 [Alphaproteobacteria bacterium]
MLFISKLVYVLCAGNGTIEEQVSIDEVPQPSTSSVTRHQQETNEEMQDFTDVSRFEQTADEDLASPAGDEMTEVYMNVIDDEGGEASDDENCEDTEQTPEVASEPVGVLSEYFQNLQERLRKEDMPREYQNGTFWIVPKLPFFALRKSLTPEALYLPKVFLWIPHIVLKSDHNLKCPSCSTDLETKGYNKNPHARRVVDMDRYVSFVL